MSTLVGRVGADSSREIRSMTLAVLPCPPLPIMVSKVSADESNTTCGGTIGNSHDLIGHLMNIRSAVGQSQVDRRRLEAQKVAHDSLVSKFDALDTSNGMPLDVAFQYFCEFTRDYVAAFMDGSEGPTARGNVPPDLRMCNPSSVCNGDPVHRAAVEFARAQDLIFGSCDVSPGRSVDRGLMSYSDLVLLSAWRILQTS